MPRNHYCLTCSDVGTVGALWWRKPCPACKGDARLREALWRERCPMPKGPFPGPPPRRNEVIIVKIVSLILPLVVLLAGLARAQSPTTAPAGYALAGPEWTTATYPTPTDLAYGASGKYAYKAGFTGKITFSNAVFGDPIVGVRKAGYWRATPTPLPPVQENATTAPTTRAAVRNTIDLAITDGNGTPATNKPYFDAFGFKGVREWIGINWNTGRANGTGGIARCNAYVAAGYTVVATVTPDELGERRGAMCADFGVAAQDLLKLDPRVIVQLGNELNMPNYGIGGSFAAGYRTFSLPIAVKLRAAGRVLAGPSIVWQTPAFIVAQAAPLVAETPTGTWAYWDGHDYTLDAKNFEDVLVAHETVANLFGARLLVSEWGGFYGTGPSRGDPLAPVLAKHRDALGRHADIAAFFVAARGSKFGDDYAWLWDAATGKRSATGDAWIASALPAAVATTRPVAKSLYFDATWDSAYWPARCPPGYTPAVVEGGGSYRDARGNVDSYFVGGHDGPRLAVDPVKAAAAAASLPAGTLYVLDENAPYDLDSRYGADVAAATPRNVAWATAMHAGNARLVLGNYNGPPVRADYYTPMRAWRGDASARAATLAWQRVNDAAVPAIAGCDVVAQSLYLFEVGEDTRGYVPSQVAEMRRVAGGRKVIAIVWPGWHKTGERIDLATFAAHVGEIVPLVDGLLLWGCDAADPLDKPYVDLLRDRVAAWNAGAK